MACDHNIGENDDRAGPIVLAGDAGRLLMRIGALHQDWLYEDKDVERIALIIEIDAGNAESDLYTEVRTAIKNLNLVAATV